MPSSSRAAPISAATRRVRSTSSTTPRARLPGHEDPVACWIRVTSPPSSSTATMAAEAAVQTTQQPVGRGAADETRLDHGQREPQELRGPGALDVPELVDVGHP